MIAAALPLVPVRGQDPVLTKTLKKVNGTAVTSPPASLNTGDVLDWVLTYVYNPNPVAPAQASIEDDLQSSLQYVPGSLVVPPDWTPQWTDSGGSVVTTEPSPATGVGAKIGFPNMVPWGAAETAVITVPPPALINTAGGTGGDGWRAIPYNGNVYVINHHQAGTYLDCFDIANGTRCPGYSVKLHVPSINGNPFNSNSNDDDNTTSGQPVEYLDRTDGRLFFPVFNKASKEVGILCAALKNKKSCGFTPLATGTSYLDIEGAGAVGTRIYAQLNGGNLGCVETAGVPAVCGPLFSSVTTTLSGVHENSSAIVGTKIYSLWQYATTNSTTPYQLSCFDTAINNQCWPAKTPDPKGVIGMLYPLLDFSGNVTAVCTLTTNQPPVAMPNFSTWSPPVAANAPMNCYTPNGSAITPSQSYYNWARTYGGGWYQAAGYGQAGYYKARVFGDGYNTVLAGRSAIGCFDFGPSTPAACTETAWPLNGASVNQKHYTIIADPERPGCMWSYGDNGILGAFRAADGLSCSSSTTVEVTIAPKKSYCAGGTVTAWDKLSLQGLTLGNGVTATLSLYNGNSTSNLVVKSNGTPYAQNLTVTAFPLILGSGGLGIGYGSGPGQYTSLRIKLEISGITNTNPWKQSPPPNLNVSWIGAPPEFCFQTKVVSCGPTVTNQALALTTLPGPKIHLAVAPAPAFSVPHALGKDCDSNLTIKKVLNGAPAGFTGTFKFNVTCSTPGGLVQQQLSITPPATSVTMSGLPAGTTCTIAEDPSLPALPTGYVWSGVPTSNPDGGVIQISAGTTNQITFTNAIRPCDDRGHIKITKRVEGAPPGFTGTFLFNIACWSAGSLISQVAQVSIPNSPSVTLNDIPTGSSCTVTEVAPLPTLPTGWFWGSPTYSPASAHVDLVGTCCPEVIVINRPKFCCPPANTTP
ncbi:MAG: DUF5979 domain-containing protein [Thermoanaerobaculia bacterium]